MEYNLKQYLGKSSGEPIDKYGCHFEFQDLYQRLMILKKQRERQGNNIIFKSFDKDWRKSPPSNPKTRHKSKSSLRSNSATKNSKRGISSDFMKISKIYSPTVKKTQQKIQSPERFLGTIKFPASIIGTRSLKRRVSRSRVYNNS